MTIFMQQKGRRTRLSASLGCSARLNHKRHAEKPEGLACGIGKTIRNERLERHWPNTFGQRLGISPDTMDIEQGCGKFGEMKTTRVLHCRGDTFWGSPKRNKGSSSWNPPRLSTHSDATAPSFRECHQRPPGSAARIPASPPKSCPSQDAAEERPPKHRKLQRAGKCQKAGHVLGFGKPGELFGCC